MRTKQFALWGNIIGTVGAVFLLRDSIVNMIGAEHFYASIYPEKYYVMIYMVVQMLGLLLLIGTHTLTWIAYAKLDKPSKRGWQLFLLISGILWVIEALAGLMLTVVTAGMITAIVSSLLNLIQGICFILAFAWQDQKDVGEIGKV